MCVWSFFSGDCEWSVCFSVPVFITLVLTRIWKTHVLGFGHHVSCLGLIDGACRG